MSAVNPAPVHAVAVGPDHIRIHYATGYAGVSVVQARRIADIRAGQGHIDFSANIYAAIAKAAVR